ncbi:hypothetical protein ACTFIW_000467 [Dictyostelium discoideum]
MSTTVNNNENLRIKSMENQINNLFLAFTRFMKDSMPKFKPNINYPITNLNNDKIEGQTLKKLIHLVDAISNRNCYSAQDVIKNIEAIMSYNNVINPVYLIHGTHEVQLEYLRSILDSTTLLCLRWLYQTGYKLMLCHPNLFLSDIWWRLANTIDSKLKMTRIQLIDEQVYKDFSIPNSLY